MTYANKGRVTSDGVVVIAAFAIALRVAGVVHMFDVLGE